MTSQGILVFLVCVYIGLSYGLGIDRCNIVTTYNVQRVVLPSNCTEGTIYWNYPERTLKVVVPEENGKFTFCVGYVHDPVVKKARITSRSGSREINLPSKKDQSECFDYNGGLSLTFFGPRDKETFMALIPYTQSKVETGTKTKT
ncbi:uncharacterized protein LOC127736107 [Mytilus californianus]|uniref:uncharacterized protein LOC127736107 n=1 Tax=Mytilus californianus TaxID=6549 RepID=UPI00224795C5|nr:uncharacterized protein LOC127736107 [Mytilus californianus]